MTCKVLRIGVFFDGTGNNLYNDEARGKSKSVNGVSNIGKLYRLYRDGEILEGKKITECEIHVKSIYIEGVGTVNPTQHVKTLRRGDDQIIIEYDKDCEPGYDRQTRATTYCRDELYHDDYPAGLAMGAEGGERVDRAIKQVSDLFDAYPQDEYQYQIDVFGFSRGAAIARDFINTLNSRKWNLKYQHKFLGLFDTVASFGAPGDNQNYKPKNPYKVETPSYIDFVQEAKPQLLVYEKGVSTNKPYVDFFYEKYNFNLSPDSAEHIVHFIAMDEYRYNFPLSDSVGAGLTYNFIGAHSDIGGGYPRLRKKNL